MKFKVFGLIFDLTPLLVGLIMIIDCTLIGATFAIPDMIRQGYFHYFIIFIVIYGGFFKSIHDRVEKYLKEVGS
jgi:hypothetical protein